MGIHIKRSTVKVRYLPHLLHLMVMLYVLVIDAEDTLMSCRLCANACACAMQSDRIGELTSVVWRGGRDEDIPSITVYRKRIFCIHCLPLSVKSLPTMCDYSELAKTYL